MRARRSWDRSCRGGRRFGIAQPFTFEGLLDGITTTFLSTWAAWWAQASMENWNSNFVICTRPLRRITFLRHHYHVIVDFGRLTRTSKQRKNCNIFVPIRVHILHFWNIVGVFLSVDVFIYLRIVVKRHMAFVNFCSYNTRCCVLSLCFLLLWRRHDFCCCHIVHHLHYWLTSQLAFACAVSIFMNCQQNQHIDNQVEASRFRCQWMNVCVIWRAIRQIWFGEKSLFDSFCYAVLEEITRAHNRFVEPGQTCCIYKVFLEDFHLLPQTSMSILRGKWWRSFHNRKATFLYQAQSVGLLHSFANNYTEMSSQDELYNLEGTHWYNSRSRKDPISWLSK